MKKSNKLFSVHSSFNPMGDQVNSIESLSQGILAGIKHQALKGATGTGKTYVLAKVLERLSQLEGKPRSVLVLSPNKTLAAQLFQEFKDFFPENAVTYFVSYYDYYQPESYLPAYDRLIEKESSINDEIDRYRNETTRTLIEREDVVVVASVSCIYGLGTPEYYESLGFSLRVGEAVPREEVIRRLVDIQYERNDQVVNRGNFRARGDRIELYPSYEWNIIQIDWLDDRIESIKTIDTLNRSVLEEREQFLVFPAKHHVMPDEILSQGLETIGQELDNRIAELNEQGKIIEIQRLRTRTTFDLEMLKTTGYCPGIENYSAHFDGRIRQPDYKCLEIP
ncbi:MAG TPA: DEAD/DEAH box helicase family protein, partial [Candidatus Hodarchaeales archaeon]|nr:DEAD/DEAH box helicase family protein [Candidatus Hodarchaeales archaeon]